LEGLGLGGSIILTQLKETGWESMDWIDLAQDKDKWLEVLNASMNLQVLYNVRNFCCI